MITLATEPNCSTRGTFCSPRELDIFLGSEGRAISRKGKDLTKKCRGQGSMDDGRIWKWGSRHSAGDRRPDRHSSDFPRCRHVDALPQHSRRVRILGLFIRALSSSKARKRRNCRSHSLSQPVSPPKAIPSPLSHSSSFGRFLCGRKN